VNSKIVITSNLEKLREKLVNEIDSKLTKEFICDEFKIDDAKAVTAEAYIAEEGVKHIIVLANVYRVEAQNSLLKLLEEPPRNIVFILIGKSKNAFLPTIRSRMSIEIDDVVPLRVDLDIDLLKMQTDEMFSFIKRYKSAKKEELRAIVQELLKQSISSGSINFNESELDMFEKSLALVNLNTRSQTILANLLLLIYHARGRES